MVVGLVLVSSHSIDTLRKTNLFDVFIKHCFHFFKVVLLLLEMVRCKHLAEHFQCDFVFKEGLVCKLIAIRQITAFMVFYRYKKRISIFVASDCLWSLIVVTVVVAVEVAVAAVVEITEALLVSV